MAKVISPDAGWASAHSRSREHLTMNERYPLDQWLDGQVWFLVQGEDFTEDVATFRSGLRHWAKVLYNKSLRSKKGYRPDSLNQPGFNFTVPTAITIQALPK